MRYRWSFGETEQLLLMEVMCFELARASRWLRSLLALWLNHLKVNLLEINKIGSLQASCCMPWRSCAFPGSSLPRETNSPWGKPPGDLAGQWTEATLTPGILPGRTSCSRGVSPGACPLQYSSFSSSYDLFIMFTGRRALSGGAPCRWYINENLNEINGLCLQ